MVAGLQIKKWSREKKDNYMFKIDEALTELSNLNFNSFLGHSMILGMLLNLVVLGFSQRIAE